MQRVWHIVGSLEFEDWLEDEVEPDSETEVEVKDTSDAPAEVSPDSVVLVASGSS